MGKRLTRQDPLKSHIWIKAKLKLEQQSIRPRLFSGVVGTLKKTMPCDFSQSFLKLHLFT